MERHAFAMKVKNGQMNAYRTRLGEIWKDLTAFLDRNQIKNFSIWNVEQLIFGYYENEDGMKLSEDEKTAKRAYRAVKESGLAKQLYLTTIYNNRK